MEYYYIVNGKRFNLFNDNLGIYPKEYHIFVLSLIHDVIMSYHFTNMPIVIRYNEENDKAIAVMPNNREIPVLLYDSKLKNMSELISQKMGESDDLYFCEEIFVVDKNLLNKDNYCTLFQINYLLNKWSELLASNNKLSTEQINSLKLQLKQKSV